MKILPPKEEWFIVLMLAALLATYCLCLDIKVWTIIIPGILFAIYGAVIGSRISK
jgi:hypothetical protein